MTPRVSWLAFFFYFFCYERKEVKHQRANAKKGVQNSLEHKSDSENEQRLENSQGQSSNASLISIIILINVFVIII